MALRRMSRATPTSKRFRFSRKHGNTETLRTFAGIAPVVLLALSACVSQGKPGQNTAAAGAPDSQTAATLIEKDTPQPRTATYNCADGGRITVENIGNAIRVVGSDGVNEEMPAAPAGQNSRFGIDHDAIVIDGREALVMKANTTPVACKR
ncbi:hypothetical protein ACFWXH_20295 [Mesorhizobium sp. NPDC059054]|uniref:hypothetical protein n=1 Tax=Mesorhizobium sp. NPDC059054 TaxID=3346711 RepID=UPI0036C37CEB